MTHILNGHEDFTQKATQILKDYEVPYSVIDGPLHMRVGKGQEPFGNRTHSKVVTCYKRYFPSVHDLSMFLESWNRDFTLFLYQASIVINPLAAKSQVGLIGKEDALIEVLRGHVRLYFGKDEQTDAEFEAEAKQWHDVGSLLDPTKNFLALICSPNDIGRAGRIVEELAERLRSRYSSYEKMDKYPLIQYCLGGFADYAEFVGDHPLPPFED